MSLASLQCILRSATSCGMNWSVPLLAPTSNTDRLRRRHASKKEMFDSFKRGRLIRRGLASRKMRRRRARSELKRNLEYSPYTKMAIFAVFVGGLAFLVFSGQQPEPTKNFVIALLVLATAITQLWINQPRSVSRSSRIHLILGVILVQRDVIKVLRVHCNSGHYRFVT